MLAQHDIALFKQITEGDVSAFEKVFEAYYGMLCLFAKKITGDIDTARDIVQDVFVTLYSNRNTLQIDTSLKSYLFKCVYHACLNWVKQQENHESHHELLKQDMSFLDDQDMMMMAELEESIRITVNGLPEQCRKIFQMNRYEGKKNNEIAEELGISVRTVETQISKALKILRTKLAEYLPILSIASLIY